MELLSWKSIKDIAGDGGIIKTIETEGQGWEKPKDRDEALGNPAASLPIHRGRCILNLPQEGSDPQLRSSCATVDKTFCRQCKACLPFACLGVALLLPPTAEDIVACSLSRQGAKNVCHVQ